MTAEVDFTSQAFFRDPAAGIERLRALGPVVATRFPIVGKVWITTTYESTARVLKDGETFTLRKEGGGLAGLRWWMPSFVATFANNMLTMDEPDHTRLREIVDEAFRRRAVLDMEPRIRAIADELAGELFADGSPADLVARYARTLPLAVICELLGLPPADRPKFIAWANTVARLAGVTDFLRMLAGLWPMKRYLEERLRLARAHGGEGLIAELVRVEAEGGRISSARDGVDGLSAAGRGLGDHDPPDQRIGLRAAQGIPACAIGSRPTGAAAIWRSRSFCASCLRCSSRSRASCDATPSSTACA